MYRRQGRVYYRPYRASRGTSLRGYGDYTKFPLSPDATKYKARYKAMKRYSPAGRSSGQKKGFWDRVGKAVAPAIGTLAGSAAAGPMGAALGSTIAGGVGKIIGNLTGFGDYRVRKNVLLEETNGPPSVINRGKEFIVRHREYIQDFYAGIGNPSPFSLQDYKINPGDSNTFPWLSTIADKFEQYRIEGMVFEYKSLYSDSVVTQNGALGSVILATEYNAGAPNFTSKQAMENYQFAQSCKPSLSVVHPIECSRPQNVLTELYVRTGSVPVGEDVKTYDFGNFQIASVGVPSSVGSGTVLGELWVSYQIALIKPRIPTTSSTYVDSGFAHFKTSGSYTGLFTAARPFPRLDGSSIVFQKDAASNIDVVQTADNTLVFTLGSVAMKYQLDMFWRLDVGNIDPASVWKDGDITVVNGTKVSNSDVRNIPSAGGALSQPGAGVAYHIQLALPAATAGNPTSTVTFNTGLWSFSTTFGVQCDLWINAIPSAASA